MNTRRLEALTAAWRDERLTLAEATELNELLRASEESRRFFRTESQMHGLIHAAVMAASVTDTITHLAPQSGGVGTAARPHSVWFQCRPLTAAAAGLVVGLFSATAVWAYVGSWRQAVLLLRESFDNEAMKLDTGFPKNANRWSGDTARVVKAEQGITPKDGTRMLRLEPSASNLWNAQSFIVDLRQLGPAPSGAARVVRVAASFRAAPSEFRDRYMARAAAFFEAPDEIDPRWMGDLWGSEENHALATSARATTFQPSEAGWQSIQLTMDLPPGGRFLVISVRAATMHGKPEMRAAHYLDDVWVTVSTTETP